MSPWEVASSQFIDAELTGAMQGEGPSVAGWGRRVTGPTILAPSLPRPVNRFVS